MDLHRINLNLLVVLDTVLDEKNVTNAAKKLFITQSALSNNLQQLREIFKDELLIREKNHMVLTGFAKELQPRLNQALQDLNCVMQSKEFDPKTSNKRFRIGMNDYMAALILPLLICVLQDEAPNIQIDVRPISSSNHEELLEIDLGLMGIYGSPLPSVMQKKLFFTDTVVCVMSCHHPLAKVKKITAKDYLRYKHIGMRTFRMFPSDPVPSYFRIAKLGDIDSQRDVQVNVPFITAFFNVLKRSNILISSIMKCMTLSVDVSGIVIKEYPLKVRTPVFDAHMVWHKRYENDIAHLWLRNIISEIGEKVQKGIDTNTSFYK